MASLFQHSDPPHPLKNEGTDSPTLHQTRTSNIQHPSESAPVVITRPIRPLLFFLPCHLPSLSLSHNALDIRKPRLDQPVTHQATRLSNTSAPVTFLCTVPGPDSSNTIRGTSPVPQRSSPSHIHLAQPPHGLASALTSHHPLSPATPIPSGRAYVDSRKHIPVDLGHHLPPHQFEYLLSLYCKNRH